MEFSQKSGWEKSPIILENSVRKNVQDIVYKSVLA